MSEFDFDELDRAVNNALSGDQPSSSGNDRTPVQNSTPSTPASAQQPPVTSPVPANPAARRASGRFMDMVHPSSDMRSNTTTVAPRSSTPQQQSATPAAPAPAPVKEQKTAPWASDHHVATGPAASPTQNSSFSSGASDPVLAPSNTPEEPRAMESPFLPDAKVEKRPLGGASVTEEQANAPDSSLHKSIEQALAEVSLVESEDNNPFATAPDWSTNTAPKVSQDEKLLEAPEAEKLLEEPESPELLEEGDAFAPKEPLQLSQEKTLGDIPNPHAEVAEEEEQQAPVSVKPVIPQPAQATSVAEPAPRVSESVPAGPASITQQYTEQPSTSAEPGAIYDTESYHQPIAPKTKKRSGVPAVVWVILLVLAGAGTGAAFYFYVLPML